MKTYTIDLSNIVFSGNLLEVNDRYEGIIYNLFKNSNDEVAVDYLDNEEKKAEKEFYENIVLFFHISTMRNEKDMEGLIKELCEYMNDEAQIFIWDIEKKRGKIFNGKLEFLLPNERKKEIIIKDINIAKKNESKQIEKILAPYFDIVEKNNWDEVFFLRGKKRGREKADESVISCNQL